MPGPFIKLIRLKNNADFRLIQADLQKEQIIKLSKSVVCNWLEALSVADYKEPQSKEQALLNMA